jgi:tetratricopeptide (TPR) repeat protein
MKIFLFLLVFALSIGCATNSSSIRIKRKEKVAFLDLIKLEEQLVAKDLTLDTIIAVQLYDNSLLFLKKFPKSIKKEAVLVLASKSSDGLNMNQKNIALIDELLASFPNSQDAPNYLYNKGKIYEEKLSNLSKAKAIYSNLIEKYPESQLAKSMILYLDFLEKSSKEKSEYLNH